MEGVIEMTTVEYLIIIVCGFGLAYTIYKLGVREGIDRYLDFCKTIAAKHSGKVMISFYGHNIDFLDPKTHEKIETTIDKIPK